MSQSDNEDIQFSEDEEDLTWESVRMWKFPFGKHQGKRIASLIRKKDTRDYLRYICEWNDLRPETKAKLEFALDYYKQKSSKANKKKK
jgi:hypothetical protein